MAMWFGAHCNQEVRFSSAVKCQKGRGCLLKDEIIFIIVIVEMFLIFYFGKMMKLQQIYFC